MKRKSNCLDHTYQKVISVVLIAISFLIVQCKTKSVRQESPPEKDTSWALIPFIKTDEVNPVLTAGTNSFTCPVLKKEVMWDEKDVFNPAAVLRDGKVYLLFRAEDKIGKYAGTSRLGLAISDDGLHFSKLPAPVFYPDDDSLKIYEWEGGVEDPRVVETEDGRYIMTYTAYDGTVARLLIASSTDLQHWTKHGLMLQGKYKNTWSKSGAIIAEQRDGKIIAQRVNGKFWMYFGDTDLFMASSDDLIHWQPLEVEGHLKSVLKPRPGYFDSRLVESGPYALIRKEGVLLLYNGMNLDEGGDATLAKGAYCAGQALFDLNDPSVLIDRLEKNFLRPDKDYEISGQVNQVCFIEGMVSFKDKWFLYYGTADSKIGVAVSKSSIQ